MRHLINVSALALSGYARSLGTIDGQSSWRAAREWLEHAKAAEQAPDIGLQPELREELCACFEGLLPTLGATYAHMLQHVGLDGRSVVGVAKELWLFLNNAHVRLHRAH